MSASRRLARYTTSGNWLYIRGETDQSSLKGDKRFYLLGSKERKLGDIKIYHKLLYMGGFNTD